MRDLTVLFLHLLATLARLAGPGGARSVVAESVLVKHQLLILNRSRKRSPHLRLSDRMVAGVCVLLMRPGRLIRSAIVLKPSTLLSLHRALVKRKYRRLFSSKVPKKRGLKGVIRKNIEGCVQFTQPLVPVRIRGATPLESEPRQRDGRRGFDGHSTAARPYQTARQEYWDRDWHVGGPGYSEVPIP